MDTRRNLCCIIVLILSLVSYAENEDVVDCRDLLVGQYRCLKVPIDPETQAEVGCTKEHKTLMTCEVADGIDCDGMSQNGTFHREVSCRYTNGHSYKTALLLSVFLGMFGIDRFYLGYPAIGLLKLSTMGFFLIFQLVDIILIATQIVGPADGSNYIIDYYGPRLIHIQGNNETFYDSSDFT